MTGEIIQQYKRHLDRTLIRRSLRMSLEERVRRLEQMALIKDEFRRLREQPRLRFEKKR